MEENQYSNDKKQKIGIALWLQKNTQLNPRQISQISGLHLFESILIHKNICCFNLPMYSPIELNIVNEQQIQYMESRPDSDKNSFEQTSKRYIPKSLRKYVPGSIIWLHKNYPHIRVKTIAKYMGTTEVRVKNIIKNEENIVNPLLVQLLDERLLEYMTKH